MTAAIILRLAGFRADEPYRLIFVVLRTLIYILLFISWGLSVSYRLIQPQVRRYIVAVFWLTAFWVAVRGIRFSLSDSYWIMRHLWYLYYLPMLFIPLLVLFISLALGKSEYYRMSGWLRFLFILPAGLFLLVLTNDLHQFAFVFPEDAAIWTDDYRYNVVYYLVFGWIVLCTAAALVIMLKKCRVPHRHSLLTLPFIPAAAAFAYSVLYALDGVGVLKIEWLKLIAGDMTVVLCLLLVAILESCIRCGLIRTNTDYEELFMVGRVGAQITDGECVICLESANAPVLTKNQMKEAMIRPVFTDRNTCVSCHRIRFGLVFWKEDVSGLTEAISEIEENNRELTERSFIRKRNLETRRRILALREKNRVTDLLNRETAAQIDRIEQLLARYETETENPERRRLLAGAAVIGAYIKRYGNLLLTAEREQTASVRDLSRCFEDSFINLELLGVQCLCTLPRNLKLPAQEMADVYHAFEIVTEQSMYGLRGVWINGRERGNELILKMEFDCDADTLSVLPADGTVIFSERKDANESSDASLSEAAFVSREDGTWICTFTLRKAGDAS